MIEVPFTYETKASGIHQTEHHEIVWYERTFNIKDLEKHPILHFEGVDYEAFIYVMVSLLHSIKAVIMHFQ